MNRQLAVTSGERRPPGASRGLTAPPVTVDSDGMTAPEAVPQAPRDPAVPVLMLLVIATAFGVSSTLQVYGIALLSDSPATEDIPRLLALNCVYWYVPALAAPAILRLATRFRHGRVGWPMLLLVHVPGALAYASLHAAVMLGARAVLFHQGMGLAPTGPCWACVARESLVQLDWLLMTYLFFVGLAHALAYRRESEARAIGTAQLETRLVEAQLQALQRQVHPHFLFNTLNTISGLVRSNVDAADTMIAQLGDLLRRTLQTSGSQLSTLDEELEALQTYLNIEQIRFGDRLKVTLDIAPDTLDAQLPTLMLQPLVENAVRHGIAPHARPGRLWVSGSRAGSRLVIEIRDSGDGVRPERTGAVGHGVGLGNTRARLEHLYRSNFELWCSNLEPGFLVTVSIPFEAAQLRGRGAA